jgi:hypothetical protein
MIVRIRRKEEEFNFRILDVSLSLDVIDNYYYELHRGDCS